MVSAALYWRSKVIWFMYLTSQLRREDEFHNALEIRLPQNTADPRHTHTYRHLQTLCNYRKDARGCTVARSSCHIDRITWRYNRNRRHAVSGIGQITRESRDRFRRRAQVSAGPDTKPANFRDAIECTSQRWCGAQGERDSGEWSNDREMK